MKDSAPGPVKIRIRQYGLDKPDTLELTAYGEAASLTHLALSAGDSVAVLTGTRLDEVAKATLNGITWSPAVLSRVEDSDRLEMNADHPTANSAARQPLLCQRAPARWPPIANAGDCRFAPPADHSAEQRRAGPDGRYAFSGAIGEPGRPACAKAHSSSSSNRKLPRIFRAPRRSRWRQWTAASTPCCRWPMAA